MSAPQNLTSQEFYHRISTDDNAVIIDVRTPLEYRDGHLPNSILIDIYNPTFQSRILELDKSKNYYLYCRSGNRSHHAGVFMLSEGFLSVHHLEDGIIDWTYDIER